MGELAISPAVLDSLLLKKPHRLTRLKHIQNECQAWLRVDRIRCVLTVTGSNESIRLVQKQLEQVESLVAPNRTVSRAVWAELLRTRRITDPMQAAVALLQREIGCRIQVDKKSYQVRILGDRHAVGVASKIFDEFESVCAEETVNMSSPRQLDLGVLRTFAQDTGVTLKVEENRIVVLGIAEAVEVAAKRLRSYEAGQRQQSLLDGCSAYSSAYTQMAISTAMARLVVITHIINVIAVGSASMSIDSLPASPIPARWAEDSEVHKNMF